MRSAAGTSVASAGVVSSGALKGATVSHVSIAGQPATVVVLATNAPLTPAEREKIRKAGYVMVAQEGMIYYCQRTHSNSQGWVNECFGFAGPNGIAKGEGSSKKGASPDTIGTPPSRALVAVVSPAN
jgi:L-aminopeptidase/D-esterase-like protein